MGKFLIGLILGVAIAGGVVFYLNNAPMKFVNKISNPNDGNNTISSAPITLLPGTKIQDAGVNTSETSNQNAKDGEYDFYQILPDKNNESSTSGDAVTSAPSQTAQQSLPKDIPAKYFIQAGVFTDVAAANNMQAQIALMGYEAKVKPANGTAGTVNRVILGPYPSVDDANNVQQVLKENSIRTTILKAK